MPELEAAIKIAKWAHVNVEWLLTGRGPKKGNHLDMRSVVISEALDALTSEDRQELLGYMTYKIQRSAPLMTEEQVSRFLKGIETFEADKPRRKTPAH